MSDEKTNAEPSGASGGSLANRTSQRNDESAEEIMAQGIAEMVRIAAEPDWIPVTERLPDEGRLVLVFPGRLPFAIRERVRWVEPLYGWTCAEEPTHWMALPSPPASDK